MTHSNWLRTKWIQVNQIKYQDTMRQLLIFMQHVRTITCLDDGEWTDQPKSAIFISPLRPSSRFSGLISRWITFLLWQYLRASAICAMYFAVLKFRKCCLTECFPTYLFICSLFNDTVRSWDYIALSDRTRELQRI